MSTPEGLHITTCPDCGQRITFVRIPNVPDVYEPHYRRVNLMRRVLCTATGMPVVTEAELVRERDALDEQVARDGD
jgi:hypothetical protein